MAREKRMIVLDSCFSCPNVFKERTPGAGYAVDYLCRAAPLKVPDDRHRKFKVVAGYIEWPSELRSHTIPKWCPLPKTDARITKAMKLKRS